MTRPGDRNRPSGARPRDSERPLTRTLAAVALSCALAAPAAAPGTGKRRQSASERPAPVERIARLKDLRLTTVLCRNGEPRAVIAIPDGEAFRNLASEINARVKACSGVELPVVVNETPEGLLSRGHVLALGVHAQLVALDALDLALELLELGAALGGLARGSRLAVRGRLAVSSLRCTGDLSGKS